MSDNFYPHVDAEFIKQCVSESGRLANNGIVKIGSTITFIIAGNKAIYKRTILVRELIPGQICLEQGISIAIRFGFMGKLLGWLEKNRNWKDGAYSEPNIQLPNHNTTDNTLDGDIVDTK
ncbi:hypothetical protein AB6805_30560 [Chitinophaga sp. RCC_12]|uniref:hypothetical protein n=1 Tax=Chitinophaga sp. RCC_12 TaxID=3239226 RepID=UPI0035245D05